MSTFLCMPEFNSDSEDAEGRMGCGRWRHCGGVCTPEHTVVGTLGPGEYRSRPRRTWVVLMRDMSESMFKSNSSETNFNALQNVSGKRNLVTTMFKQSWFLGLQFLCSELVIGHGHRYQRISNLSCAAPSDPALKITLGVPEWVVTGWSNPPRNEVGQKPHKTEGILAVIHS